MVPICIPLITGEGEYLYTGFSHIYFSISVVLHCGCPLELLCVCAYVRACLLTRTFLISKDLRVIVMHSQQCKLRLWVFRMRLRVCNCSSCGRRNHQKKQPIGEKENVDPLEQSTFRANTISILLYNLMDFLPLVNILVCMHGQQFIFLASAIVSCLGGCMHSPSNPSLHFVCLFIYFGRAPAKQSLKTSV